MSDRKAILITGSAARIGAVLAKGLADDGWAVCIHYRRSEGKAFALVKDITANGGQAACVQANLSVPGDVSTLVPRASEALGVPLTALINNASTFADDRAETFTPATMDHHMDVNLRAPLRLSQALWHQLPKGVTGSIINMIDQRVLKPNPLFFTYGISKSAFYWSTKTLAQSLAPYVRVNGIGPGPTLQNTGQSRDEFEAEESATILGRGSPPETILQAARYLLAAESVTGQMLAVDSGQHLTWRTADLLYGGDDGA